LVDHNYDQNILVSLSNVKPEKNTLDLPLILEGSWTGGRISHLEGCSEER